LTRDEVFATPRLAGQVQRYHTWSMHRQQSVGEHTWQTMRIYWQIWGPLPPDVCTHLIWHDAGELVLGDLPFPVKKNNPRLKHECDVIERQALVKMIGGNIEDLIILSEEEKHRVKICDLIDMLEMGQTEFKMGNQYALPIINDVRSELGKCLVNFSHTEREKIMYYVERFAS
jgi:5'-deoxynucleotidase YfbR-like HD superfamily hydrolase